MIESLFLSNLPLNNFCFHLERARLILIICDINKLILKPTKYYWIICLYRWREPDILLLGAQCSNCYTIQESCSKMSNLMVHLRFSVIKAVLKNVATLTGKHLCWSRLLINLWAFTPATLFKKDSNTGVFLWILRNF